MKCAAFAIASVVMVALTIPLNADDKDTSSLEGTWLPSEGELAGKKLPEGLLKNIKLTIKDSKYTVTVDKEIDQGTVKLDRSAKPMTVDIIGTEGPNKGKTILAIYELTGDTLKVCYDLSGKARPTAFESKPDSQLFLVTYKREKK